MRHTWIVSVAVLVLVAVGSYLLYVRLQPEDLPKQVLYGNGHIEGIEVRVSAEVSGNVIENSLVEGQAVSAGTLLVRIDPSRFELERAKANAEIAALRYEQSEVERERDTWKHHTDLAKRDYDRYTTLSATDVVSSQQLEKAENKLIDARGHLGVLEAKLKAVMSRLEAANKSARLIEMNLDKTSIKAPIDGTVLTKAVERGEFLAVGGTVAVLVNLARLELKVFIREKDIAKVHLNDRARVRVDAFPDRRFDAKVIRVDQKAQFTPREIHMPEERARMVFGVTLSLANPDGVLKPGMPADAWILWKTDANWPDHLPVPQ